MKRLSYEKGYLSGNCYSCGKFIAKSYGYLDRMRIYCNRDCFSDTFFFKDTPPDTEDICYRYGKPDFDDNHYSPTFLEVYRKCKTES